MLTNSEAWDSNPVMAAAQQLVARQPFISARSACDRWAAARLGFPCMLPTLVRSLTMLHCVGTSVRDRNTFAWSTTTDRRVLFFHSVRSLPNGQIFPPDGCVACSPAQETSMYTGSRSGAAWCGCSQHIGCFGWWPAPPPPSPTMTWSRASLGWHRGPG